MLLLKKIINFIFSSIILLISLVIIWLIGWKIGEKIPNKIKKCVIIGASHTSNWDFMLFCLYYQVLGLKKTKGFIKKELFKNKAFAIALKSIGFIPVDREKNKDMVSFIANYLDSQKEIKFVITPEGTRSRREKWKTGFYHIALKSKVPIALIYADYKKKIVGVHSIFKPTGDIDKDMIYIKKQYEQYIPCYPKLSGLNHKTMEKQNVIAYTKFFLRLALLILLFLSSIYNQFLFGL